MKKDVLLINDMAGYGKVALSVMIPTLSKTGNRIHNLVSAIVSNTLDYGKFKILDTSDYMKQTMAIWDELNFHFDAIATGFITDYKQAELVSGYLAKKAKEGVLVLCDPIMGDDGSLYPGMDESRVEAMKLLVEKANYMVPNYTEACLLTNTEYKENVDQEEIDNMILKLRDMNHQSIIITSVYMDEKHCVVGYDHKTGENFYLPYDYINVRLPGTGDIFASVVLAGLLAKKDVKTSVKEAMQAVYNIILKNSDNEDKFAGVRIEEALQDDVL